MSCANGHLLAAALMCRSKCAPLCWLLIVKAGLRFSRMLSEAAVLPVAVHKAGGAASPGFLSPEIKHRRSRRLVKLCQEKQRILILHIGDFYTGKRLALGLALGFALGFAF